MVKTLKGIRHTLLGVQSQFGLFNAKPLTAVRGVRDFWRDYRRFRRLDNSNFQVNAALIRAYMLDKSAETPVDPVYFYQDTWAARKIFELRPSVHVDVGSHHKTVGILSQFVPITMVDIRPLPVTLPNLTFKMGDILALPFDDESVASISSLCVIEHIGLGRYGDELNAHGSEQAARELQRVTQSGGTILISVPIDSENRVYFNANRAFTRDYILGMFDKCMLVEERYQYGTQLVEQYVPTDGFGTGLFLFRKR